MSTVTVGTLDVPGAQLRHETRGSGPPLLLIHGGGGDAEGMALLAEQLAGRFTVIGYDRRGCGSSPLTTEPVGDADYLRANADDAALLLAALGTGPAHVLGSSSGAVVALELLVRHPDAVATVVAHEPPVVTLLPDAAERIAFFDQVRRVHREQGLEAAMRLHLAAIGIDLPERPADLPADLPPSALARLERFRANQEYWLLHEVDPVVRYVPDLEALRARRAQLVPAGGRESRDQYPYWPNQVIAARLGLTVVDLPGDHIGYVPHPVEFAAGLTELLAVTGDRR